MADQPKAPRGRVVWAKRITREMVQASRGSVFVFGDNMMGVGLGGQAREMRGEPNAIGVPTKWRPASTPSAYFTDDDLQNSHVLGRLREAFTQIRAALAKGRNVVIPADGIGTGRAELPTRAPRLFARIEAAIATLDDQA